MATGASNDLANGFVAATQPDRTSPSECVNLLEKVNWLPLPESEVQGPRVPDRLKTRFGH